MWQASVVVSIALIVGLPLGILWGRLIWSAFADRVGLHAGGRRPVGDPGLRHGRRHRGRQSRRLGSGDGCRPDETCRRAPGGVTPRR